MAVTARERTIRAVDGFMLVELLIVIVLIGLLAAIATPVAGKFIRRSEDLAACATIRQVLAVARLEAVRRTANVASGGTPPRQGGSRRWASPCGPAGTSVTAIVSALTGRKVRVQTLAGSLEVAWPKGREVMLTGPVELVARGTYYLLPKRGSAPFTTSS